MKGMGPHSNVSADLTSDPRSMSRLLRKDFGWPPGNLIQNKSNFKPDPKIQNVTGFLEIPSHFAILKYNQSPQKKRNHTMEHDCISPSQALCDGFSGKPITFQSPCHPARFDSICVVWRQPTPNSKL